MNLNKAELRALLRLDLTSFIERCFHQLNPQTPFSMNWHIEVIAEKLEAVRRGEIRRLIINVPPRSLKSIAASVALPAWWLGHHPSAQLLSVTYGQDLSDKLALDCRTIMTSDWYQELFPTRLSSLKQSIAEFMTTEQGLRLATSVGGTLTGRGADVIIIDDPLKPDQALSDSQRRTVNDWYDHTLYSRLNDKEKGAIIIIMQRLHEDDLVGHVLELGPWEVVRFPAIAERDEMHNVESPLGRRTHRRQAGAPLHPARESPHTLDTLRRTLGPYHFAGQYQQAPAPLEGGLVKRDWFQYYTGDPMCRPFERIIQSWDTANKATELSDYSVGTTWGLFFDYIYLIHVLRERLNYPELKRVVRTHAQAFDASVILIEDKASGTQLIQELIGDGVPGIHPCTPERDKVMRLHAQTATIENGRVLLPKEAPWLDAYLHELLTFPNGKHDDQVDSTSQALEWIKRGQSFQLAFSTLPTSVSRTYC